MKSLVPILIFLCIGCSQLKKGNNHKTNIDLNEIDFISIKKELYATDSIYFLSKKEIQIITKEWNNSENKGMYKMIPKYWIRINLKNDSVRIFRNNGKLIKENNDLTYAISKPDLIPTFWKKATSIPSPPKPSIINKCDSISKIAIEDYKNGIREYTEIGMVEATEFVIFYSKYMKQHYNIIMKANCTPNFIDHCYSNSMISEIEKEYGKEFMESTREKAKQALHNSKK